MEHTTHFDGCGCPLRSGMAVAVWMTEDFAENYGTRSADGRFRFTMALGNPDARGVYNPVITKHDDPLPVFAERDALRLRVAAMEAALLGVVRNERAGAMSAYFAPGGTYERCLPIVDHAVRRANEAVGGDTTALRALLVEAVYDTAKEWDDYGSPDETLRAWAEKQVDKRLGASKEGK